MAALTPTIDELSRLDSLGSMRNSIFIAALAAVSVQCAQRPERRDTPTVRAIPAQSVTAIEAQALHSAPVSVTAIAASMLNEELYACTEVNYELPQASLTELTKVTDAGAQFILDQDLAMWLDNGKTLLADILIKRRGKEALLVRPAGTPLTISKPCREQFPRPVIASCTTPLPSKIRDAGPPVDITMQTLYFQITDDTVMNHCVAAGSTWWEAPRDSLEYARASAERARQALRAFR